MEEVILRFKLVKILNNTQNVTDYDSRIINEIIFTTLSLRFIHKLHIIYY